MTRKFFLVVFISLFIAAAAFAQYELDIKIPAFKSVTYYAAAVPGEEEYSIPYVIAYNQHFLDSLESNRKAMEFFELGQYDVSASFAQEAIVYAELSDEYVAEHMITETERLLDWAYYNNLMSLYPDEYNASRESYEMSLVALSGREWVLSIDSSITSIEILTALEVPASQLPVVIPPAVVETPASIIVPEPAVISLPGQYTVRPWAVSKDCLWNIAGYSWVYGDPTKWRVLYEANKSRMPQPDNPDLIHPGFVLNIPSINGEARQGMWDPNTDYGK